VLARATELRRTVLTINRRDFRLLHQSHIAHAGIVICTQDPDFVGQAERIDTACRGLDSTDTQLIRIYRLS